MSVQIRNYVKNDSLLDERVRELISLLYENTIGEALAIFSQEKEGYTLKINVPSNEPISLFFDSDVPEEELKQLILEHIWSSFFNFYESQKGDIIFYLKQSSFWDKLFHLLESQAVKLEEFTLPIENPLTRKMRWLLNVSDFKGKRYVAATVAPNSWSNKHTARVDIPCWWRAISLNGYDFVIEIPEGETLQISQDGYSHIRLSDPVSPDKQDDVDFLADLIGWRVVDVKCGTIVQDDADFLADLIGWRVVDVKCGTIVLGNDKGNKIILQKPLNIVTNSGLITMSDF